jgi:hypothetical protein
LSNVLAGYPYEVVKLRSMVGAASDIKDGKIAATRTQAEALQLPKINPA